MSRSAVLCLDRCDRQLPLLMITSPVRLAGDRSSESLISLLCTPSGTSALPDLDDMKEGSVPRDCGACRDIAKGLPGRGIGITR